MYKYHNNLLPCSISQLYAKNDSIQTFIQTFKSYLKSPTEKTFSFSKVCEPEVQQIINQMKKKQSRGVDEISSQLLKVIGKEICKSLTLIINQMIETGIYPENFKIAKITPIHKKR